MNNGYAWYSTLIKPSWSPPSWLFGPVWSFLYIIIAITFGLVFYKVITGKIPWIVALPFVLNLIFNFSFTYLQFVLKNNLLAAIDISLALTTLVWAFVAIYPYINMVVYVNIPYLMWVLFATILQFTITYLNRWYIPLSNYRIFQLIRLYKRISFKNKVILFIILSFYLFFSFSLNSTNDDTSSVQSTYLVVRVVDGDTIVVTKDNKEQKVRLIGVDTPETVDPRKDVQCFGKEASEYLTKILKGKKVSMESDPSQEDLDKYGRLLRYVYLEDTTLVNKAIIYQGYGFEYTYKIPYKYQADFKDAQKYAETNKVGLWEDTVCNYKNI